MAQADKMRAKATKATAAQQMARRAERLLAGLEDARGARPGRQAALPDPGAVRADPADRGRAVEVLRLAGGLHRRRPGHRPRQPGGRARAQRRRQDHAAAAARPGRSSRTPARCMPGHGLRLGYYAQEHETLDPERTVLENMRSRRAGPRPTASCAGVLGSFLFSGDDGRPAGRHAVRRREDPAGAGRRWSSQAANVLLLDEPTNNLDPACREQVLDALRPTPGAVVLVTHDEGAVEALQPEQVILLPDGVEDHWSDDLVDLVALA